MFDLLPHGICLSASPEIIALMVTANFGIALAYCTIPVILLVLSIRFPTPMPAVTSLFCVFIAGCGTTHLMDIVTMYVGGNWYWLQAGVLSITAVASLTTSAVLIDVLLRPGKWVPQNGQSV